MSKNTNIVANEAFKPVVFALIVALISDLILSSFIASFFYIFALFLLIIYRNPERYVHTTKKELVAPIDGQVVAIDTTPTTTKIYVEVSLLDTHIIRAPQTGEYQLNIVHGINLDPLSPKAKQLGSKALFEFENIKIEFLSGKFNPIFQMSHGHNNAYQNDRLGIFLHGLVTLEIPSYKQLHVNIGDKLKASESIIAKV